MDGNNICGVCLEKIENLLECVVFTSAMRSANIDEELTYLDGFELVTHLKLDIDALQLLYLCTTCRGELEDSFKFLRKAEKCQQLLNEKIELATKQNEPNQDLDLNDIIEEIVSEDYSAVPVLTDAMLSTQSTDCFDELYKSDNLSCGADLKSVNLSPPNMHEDQLVLSDIIITADEVEVDEAYDDEKCINNKDDERFECSLCPKNFSNQASLKAHLKYHRRKKKASMHGDACKICKKKFSTLQYLQQHMVLVHSDERTEFKCEQCEKIYFTQNSLRNHMRIHTGETTECTECHKSFLTQYDLRIHMRFHTRDYPYACDLCDKKFAIKGHLRTHMWEHQGLKLQCDQCRKLFTSTKALADHAFVHSGQKPYPCSHCERSYPSKQKYKFHLMSMHQIEFDELKHGVSGVNQKSKPRRKNLTLVQTDDIKSQIEVCEENECFSDDNSILEVI